MTGPSTGPSRIRWSVATKLLVSFLLLTILSFGVIGYLAISTLNEIGVFAEESSKKLGNDAARDSTLALKAQGEASIKQKGADVSKQIEIYMKGHPGTFSGALDKDTELAAIAVQSVGRTGYTALYEKHTGIMRLHPNPALVNFDMHNLKDQLPSMWKIYDASIDGSVAYGYYDWAEPDGSIRQKFMYMLPVAGYDYMVAATTYIDEFTETVVATRAAIDAETAYASDYIRQKIQGTLLVFIISFSLVLLLAALLIIVIARRITNPLRKLAYGAGIIGEGNLDYRVEVKTGDELENLAGSFNKMASDLKGHTEELLRTSAEKERIAKELDIARNIQQSFLPEFPPLIKGIEIAAMNLPAREVGGDFYDFIPIGEDKWGLVIADVSGKGVPAALFMALSRTLVRANAVGDISVVETIRRANDLIAEHDRASMFVTLFYGVLDPVKMTLTYVSAGHNPSLMLKSGSSDVVLMRAEGIALGVLRDIKLEVKEISLDSGDVVLLYTDGVTEAINASEEQFGVQRLCELSQQSVNLSAEDIIKRIEQTVVDFSGDQPQFDDFTLMVLKIL